MTPNENSLTHLDLFSGIGGFALAANKAGFRTVGFAEVDPLCIQILNKHWPDIINYGDIRSLKFTEHVNLITGGFPCQPFSVAGKQKGKHDSRYLWDDFYRIIQQVKPCWVVIENVTGLIPLALDDILADLENTGYATEAIVLPACAANAPHRRDRLWIIANRPSIRCNRCKNTRQGRHLQIDKEWNVSAIYKKWEGFKPKPCQANTAQDWIEFNARISGNNDGLSGGLDRIKAIGNAIVPQTVYPILAGVYYLELAASLE